MSSSVATFDVRHGLPLLGPGLPAKFFLFSLEAFVRRLRSIAR